MADISFVLSGGVTNQDPDNSFGGPPSPTPIISGLENNLFADVTGAEVSDGLTDYRCIYLFNESNSDDFADFSVWINSQVAGGSDVYLGVILANEIQQLTFVNTAGGNFTLELEGNVTPSIDY